jgi:uncharacterized protein (DUF1330 family)
MYILVRLWIRKGREADFEAYERKMCRIMARYGGAMEITIRPGEVSVGASEAPSEVHVLRLPSHDRYEAYRRDPERQTLSADRAAAISHTDVLVGEQGPTYAT